MSVHVKICGFTRAEDVAAGVAVGIDTFGFNLARGPRKLDLDHAADLARRVPSGHGRVALFVDATEPTILTAMQATRCQTVQLHGDEPPEVAESLAKRFPVIKAFRIRDAAALAAVVGYPADIYLLDAWVPGEAGGTGTTWDHALLVGRNLGRPILLAGGLTPDNVGAAVATVHPWGVDCSSGVERGVPGVKDHDKIREFVRAAHGIG